MKEQAMIRPEMTMAQFTRHEQMYLAHYDDGRLVKLINKTSGQVIPSDTQTFRRLADNNRGNKFKVA
jgi:hypothetical protein